MIRMFRITLFDIDGNHISLVLLDRAALKNCLTGVLMSWSLIERIVTFDVDGNELLNAVLNDGISLIECVEILEWSCCGKILVVLIDNCDAL